MSESAHSLARSDGELLEATRSGDPAAYGELYGRHVAAAQGLARQLVRGASDADDVVAEAFERVLKLLRRGGGPADGFRPYLLTAVRRVAYDRHRDERRTVTTGTIEDFDPGQPFIDPAVEGMERSLIARAFLSLPERWRAVLWHTEIEGAKPADVAPLLGLTANGVAALSYRAREGLRQAYLQMHLSVVARNECRPTLAKLGAYVRGGLSKRDTEAVHAHLQGCQDCRAVYAELTDVNSSLRGMVAPIFLGPLAAGYLATTKAGASWLVGSVRWARRTAGQQQLAATGGLAAAVAVAVMVSLLVTGSPSSLSHRHRAAPGRAAPGSTAPSPTAPGPTAPATPTPQGPSAPRRPAGPTTPGSAARQAAAGAPGTQPGAGQGDQAGSQPLPQGPVAGAPPAPGGGGGAGGGGGKGAGGRGGGGGGGTGGSGGTGGGGAPPPPVPPAPPAPAPVPAPVPAGLSVRATASTPVVCAGVALSVSPSQAALRLSAGLGGNLQGRSCPPLSASLLVTARP